jgi:hypothetical protein
MIHSVYKNKTNRNTLIKGSCDYFIAYCDLLNVDSIFFSIIKSSWLNLGKGIEYILITSEEPDK